MALREAQADTDCEDPEAHVAWLRQVIEEPEQHEIESFLFRGAHVYLAVGHPYAPGDGLDAIREDQETGALEAAGFELVATG